MRLTCSPLLLVSLLASSCRPRERDRGDASASAAAGALPARVDGGASLTRFATPDGVLASMARTEVTTPDGVHIVRYTGYVPSFDGLPLDVDLTVPACAHEPCAARPLVAFFHGWALDKKTGSRTASPVTTTSTSDGTTSRSRRADISR